MVLVRSRRCKGHEKGPWTGYPEERGALFEGLVAQLIRAYRDYRNLCDDVYY